MVPGDEPGASYRTAYCLCLPTPPQGGRLDGSSSLRPLRMARLEGSGLPVVRRRTRQAASIWRPSGRGRFPDRRNGPESANGPPEASHQSRRRDSNPPPAVYKAPGPERCASDFQSASVGGEVIGCGSPGPLSSRSERRALRSMSHDSAQTRDSLSHDPTAVPSSTGSTKGRTIARALSRVGAMPSIDRRASAA